MVSRTWVGAIGEGAPTQESNRLGPVTLLILMGSLWGLQFAMLKQAARGGYSDLTILMIALVLLSVIFLLISALKREPIRPSLNLCIFLAVTALLGYVVPLTAALFAAEELSAGVLALIASMAPVVAASAALLLRTETVSLRRLFAVALGAVSVVLILTPELDLPDRGKARWMLVAMVVPLAYGIESVYIARFWPSGLSALHAVTGETVVAAIMVAPLLILSGVPLPERLSWNDAEIAILIFVAAGVMESLLYFYLIRKTGGVFVNFGTFVSLFAGVAWGILLFAETHTGLTWLAVAALAGALVLAARDSPAPLP